jgi:ribosomal protein L12E/L44/L45/RPP1/RPP2
MFAAMQDRDVDRVLDALGPALAASAARPARAAAGNARP